LYYYLYRFYDPNLQRWLNEDPVQDEGFEAIKWGIYLKALQFYYPEPEQFQDDQDLYEFILNDPVDNFDILGLAAGGRRPPSPPPGPPPPPSPPPCPCDAKGCAFQIAKCAAATIGASAACSDPAAIWLCRSAAALAVMECYDTISACQGCSPMNPNPPHPPIPPRRRPHN
jgi:hypothetical protein